MLTMTTLTLNITATIIL